MKQFSRRDFLRVGLTASAALAAGGAAAAVRSARAPEHAGNRELAVRGYLLHLTHYDPTWFKNKQAEPPFSLELALDLVAALAGAEFNLLVVDCADAVAYRSHPELARPYTQPMSRLGTLAASARARGLELVPKLNFSRSEIHKHNHWMRAPGEDWGDHFDDEAYWKKAFELVDELIEVCQPNRFFHIGMDEDHDRSYTQYIAALQTLRAGLSKRNLRAVMWNDSAIDYPTGMIHVEKALAAEKAIPKDAVQVLWNYHSVPTEGVKRIREQGFELWGAPGSHNPEQTIAFRHAVLMHGGTGLLMTTWSACTEDNRAWLTDRIRTMGPVYRGEA